MKPNAGNGENKPAFEVLKRNLLRGISVLLPIFITAYLIVLLLRLAYQGAGQYLRTIPGLDFPGVGVVAILGLILLVGFFSGNVLGRYFFRAVDGLLTRTPVISLIYPIAKRFTDYLFSNSVQDQFKRVVYVEFPEEQAYTVGFITHESLGRLEQALGEAVVSVFVPMAPVPLTGFIIMVPKEKVKIADISVDEAVKFVVSCGVVFPEDKESGKESV